MRSTEDVIRFPSDRRPELERFRFEHSAFRSAADAFFRQWRTITALWALVTLAFLAFLILNPREYESEITFLVRNSRPDPLLATDSNPTLTTRTADVSDAQIATEVQLLSSRELAGQVLDATGYSGPGGVARDKAITKLQKKMQLMPLLKSSMIRVRYAGPTAAQSARVLRVLASTYLDRHLRLHGATGSFVFFEQQAADAEKHLKDAQAKLLGFQQQAHVVSAADQKTLLLQKSMELQVSLHQAEAELDDAVKRICTIKPQFSSQSARISTQSRRMANQYSIERLNTMLVELRNRRTELLTKFRPGERMVTQVDQEIADTQRALDQAERGTASEDASDVNPLRQSLEADLLRTQSVAAGLRGRIQAMKAQDRNYRQELARLEELIPQEQERLRDEKVAEENYLLYAKKREESRIGERMDKQKIANVVIAEPPRVPELPRGRLTGAAISTYVLAMAIATILALMMRRMNRTVETPWQLEAVAEVPVLGTIPLRPAFGLSAWNHRRPT